MPCTTTVVAKCVLPLAAAMILPCLGACASSGRSPAVTITDSGPGGYTVVPLKIDSHLPTVPVSIGGVEVPLLIDTGGFEEISLSPAVLRKLDVIYTGRRIWRVGVHGLLSLSSAREFIVPELRIGDVCLANVRGHEFHFADLHLAHKPPPALENGIIGLALLRHFSVIVDYRAGVCVLATGGRYPPPYQPATWTSCSVDLSDLNIGIRGDVVADGRTLRCVWDTGASHSLIRPGLVQPEEPAGRNGHPSARLSKFVVAARDCGPFDFVAFDFRQPPVDAIIGYNFFKDHTVLLDFDNARLAFD